MIEFKVTTRDEDSLRHHLVNKVREIDRDADRWRSYIWRKEFWTGLLLGVLVMCVMDLTDMHFCIGDCDDKGIDLR